MKLFIGVLAAAAMVAGCQADPKPAARATSPSVLDVSAPRSSYPPADYTTSSYAPSSYPPAATPVAYAGPAYLPPSAGAAYVPSGGAVVVESAPEVQPSPRMRARTGKSTYTVKQGDTLYHIAREQYGDGKQWRQIAAANPDVTPTALKVGQKLVMP